MKPIYRKILKELEKGNAVLLQVNIVGTFYNQPDRYRLVTPINCYYARFSEYHIGEFSKSCFVSNNNAFDIIKRMEKFDEIWFQIEEMQVLK